MVQGKLLSYGEDNADIIKIRKKVFQYGYQDVPDSNFDICINVLVYDDLEANNAIATGRLVYDNDEYMIRDIAVLEDYRNKYYGDFAVRMLISKAFSSGIKELYIISPIETITFFEKIGFININNEINLSDNIKMVLKNEYYKTKCNKMH